MQNPSEEIPPFLRENLGRIPSTPKRQGEELPASSPHPGRHVGPGEEAEGPGVAHSPAGWRQN